MSQIELEIVHLFLCKLELLTQDERREILRVIELLNHPIFYVGEAPKKK